MTGSMVALRKLLQIRVHLEGVVDLRPAAAQRRFGLSTQDLASPVGDYEACQRVGELIAGRGARGLIAPAAEGGGETLAIFGRTPAAGLDVISVEDWDGLPPDPRR